MSIVIAALSVVVVLASIGALALRAIIRKRDLARARDPSFDERLRALENGLSREQERINRLWREINCRAPLGVKKDVAPADAPPKDRALPSYGDHHVQYEYTFPSMPPIKEPVKRHRTNNRNYRGHGKGTNARLKLTEEQMLVMMEMSDKGMTGHQIADVFGVSRTTVQRVVAGTFQTGKQRGKA